MLRSCIIVSTFLTHNFLQAQATTPLYLKAQLLSWLSIPITILLEFLLIAFILKKDYAKIFLATVLMNMISGIAGLIATLIYPGLIIITPFLIFKPFTIHEEFLSVMAFLIITLLINITLEYFIAKFYLNIDRNKLLFAITIANISSIIFLLFYENLIFKIL